MMDPRKEHDGGSVSTPEPKPRQATQKQHSSTTEGTNRDFDESGDAKNQDHGHPREQGERDE
jgi:hypothetical protein